MTTANGWRPSLRHWSLFAVTWHLATWGGLALLVWAAAMTPWADARLLGPLGFLIALAFVAELRPVVLPGNDPHGVVVSDAFIFAILFVFGIGPAMLTLVVVTIISELFRRKPPWKVAFNAGQYSVSLAAAWPVMFLAGQDPTFATPATDVAGSDLWWMALTWATYFLVNNTLVAAMSEDEGLTFSEAFFEDFWYYVLTHFAVFVLSPVVTLVAIGPWQMLPLLLLPLFAVYKAAAISREKDHAASHDPLTALPNRRLMAARIAEAIDVAGRDGHACAVLLLDLNRFKEVNDTLGHAAGDEALAVAAARIRNSVRPEDTVARMGGDEFAVVMPIVHEALPAVEIAARVRQNLREPLHLDDAVVDLDVSIGIALYPDHGQTTEELLRRADVAMYLAKENRSHIEVFRTEHEAEESGRLSVLGSLRRAIEDRELVVHYQPVVTAADYQVMGMEALVRWNHPTRGLLPPAEFLPIAESSGLMYRLTRLVIEDAVQQAALWREAGHEVPVAVNVSLRDLAGLSLAETVESALTAHQLPGELLHLEITERLLMVEPDGVNRTVHALSDLGVRLSLDDFGTGFASLVMLRRLPLDHLKIDGAFIRRLAVSEDDRAIVHSIVELAHALGIRTIAEGVETARVLQHLVDLECDGVQGWHIGRDMPADEAGEWLRVHAATHGQRAGGARSLSLIRGSGSGASAS